MFRYYWKILDKMTGKSFKSLPKCYYSLGSAKKAAEEYIIEYLPDSDSEDVVIKIYEKRNGSVIDRFVYSEHYAFMKPDQYSWRILDWITGDFLNSGISFCNMADAKRSLNLQIKRFVAKGRDPEDFRFQVVKYNPRTRYTEIVCADSKEEEKEKSLQDQHRECVLKDLDVEELDEKEVKKLMELAKEIRRGSVVSIFSPEH